MGGLADGFVSPREGYGQVRAAAARALALDSSQADAYAMLSQAVLALELDAPRPSDSHGAPSRWIRTATSPTSR